METKKIAFGFTKTIKKPHFQLNKKEEVIKNKAELITFLEDKEIKILGEKSKVEDKPLVIPLKDSSKTTKGLESLKIRKAVLEGIEIEKIEKNTKGLPEIGVLDNPKWDSLEKRAITELLIEARKDFNVDSEETTSKLTLVVKPEELPLNGAKESTVEDYESIPINQFGLAMLRGMGLKEDVLKKKSVDDDILCPRPKGMGLGADKAIKRQPILIPPEENEKLEIKKSAYVKILAGKHKSQYGQIEGFDDQTGRIVVKLALGGLKESLGEYLLQPVSKKEFQTYGKVINSEKYEEYKKKQMESESRNNIKEEKYVKGEPNVKVEKYDSNYDKSNQKSEHGYKSEFKKEDLKIKTEKDDCDQLNTKSNVGKSDYNFKNKSSSSRRYSFEEEKLLNSVNSGRNRNDKSENYRNSRQNNRIDDYSSNRNTYSKRRSRSIDFRKTKDESDSDSSESSPERQRHKSAKSKSSKSKKTKKNKHKYNNSSSEDDKKHKKKTKKSRKSRSRSRSKHRR